MIAWRLFKLAFKNVTQSRKKSMSAIMAIAGGFIALNLFQAYIYDSEIIFDQTFAKRSMFGDVLIRHEVRQENLNILEQNKIREFLDQHHEQIVANTRFLNITGSLNTGHVQTVFSGYGYDLKQGHVMRSPSWAWNVVAGQPLDESLEEGLLVGRKLAEIINCKEKKPFAAMTSKKGYKAEVREFSCETPSVQLSMTTKSGQVSGAELPVLGIIDGIFSDIDQRLIVTSIEVAQSLMNTNEVSMWSLKLKDEKILSELKTKFDQEVRGDFPLLQFKSWKEYEIGDFYLKSIEFLHIFRNFISVVIISIGALSVLSTFYRLVFERTREIATLLSIGYLKIHVYSLFLMESLLLSILGVFIGIGLSFVISFALNLLEFPYKLGMLSEPVPFSMTLNPQLIIQSALIIITIGVIVSLLPIRRVLKMNITEALVQAQ